MSRAKITVKQLALEAHLDPDETLLMLWEHDIRVRHEGEDIPRKKLKVARRALGLPATIDKYTIEDLSAAARVSAAEARDVLVRSRIVGERTVRVPNAVAKMALACLRAYRRDTEKTEAQQSVLLNQIEAAAIKKRSRIKNKRKEEKAIDEEWKMVGRLEDDLVHLTPGDVEEIHWVLVRDFRKSRDPIDPPGVRNRAILESALFRPHTALGHEAKYPSMATAAAALFHALVHDHCFHNGNKRTALVSLLVFLDKNGYVLNVTQDELFDYVLALGKHVLLSDEPGPGKEFSDRETLEIARWLNRRIRKVRKGEFLVKFHDLREILTSYGCEFQVREGSFINIFRDGKRSQVWYGGEAREVEPNTVHKIRHDLELDEPHGYDSDIFYNRSPKIPDFIIKYRKTLNCLAKM